MKVRDRGVVVGRMSPGSNNCITDVTGVKVGHETLDYTLDDKGEGYACTGVTAILPHAGNVFKEKVTAASYVLNGFGKTTGLVQVNELGTIEAPIMLSNTFAVPAVTQGTLEYMLSENEDIGETTGTINIVVGECNDSYLNSIRHFPVKPEHAKEAIKKASTMPAEEGAVGAGKGMVCFGHKGGIGTASRVVKSADTYTIGCLVLSNFGKKEEFMAGKYGIESIMSGLSETADGSIIIVLATNAPLSDRQLLRLAKRCGIGLGRTGSHFSHGSGDIVIAFSTANQTMHYTDGFIQSINLIRDDHPLMNELFAAAAEATEEAILNSLSQAETTKGRKGRVVEAYPFL
ncbi:DmpA family aminopeptidase [Mesobacillus selenatarsenatis]|uniref:D-aminopeptidase n=1 Tax=Mesobacillus selenatarsenatis (strain DSM 18680 / JCM 14380 / FERM P-15431 / SF-1) TaxID=1321606 RepID=A0A0A8X4U7_MESS1|nr:P1 family peptidase [Mesobacillus selenatarsenatis]GAM14918.1 D-aminopeptidase [Mesobacillus selenatarsenatis SF-1]